MPERPISLNTRLKIQASCSDCSYFMRCRNNLPYTTETYQLTCFVSTIPGKFQPTGSYNHADKSGQLPKTEPLRLRYSSLQRLWHWQLVTGGLSENEYYTLQKSLNIRKSLVRHSRSRFLCAKVLRTGETPSDACAFSRRIWRQPSANFLMLQKFGYSVCILWLHTCLFLPLVRSHKCT